MTFAVEAGGQTRTIEIRRTAGAFDVLVDGRRYAADLVRSGSTWSLLIGRTPAGADESMRAGAPPAGPVAQIGGDAASAGTGLAGPARSYELSIVEQAPGELLVYVDGRAVPVSLPGLAGTRRGPRNKGGGGDERRGPRRIAAPMPGRIVKVLVKVGDVVTARQGLVVVEAMKMENELRSPTAGTVTEIRVAEGMLVEANAVVVVVE